MVSRSEKESAWPRCVSTVAVLYTASVLAQRVLCEKQMDVSHSGRTKGREVI